MKKLFSLTLLITALGSAAPLASTQATPARANSRIVYTYEKGFQLGEAYAQACPAHTYSEWLSAKHNASDKASQAYAAGADAQANYYIGYYDGLGDEYAPYC